MPEWKRYWLTVTALGEIRTARYPDTWLFPGDSGFRGAFVVQRGGLNWQLTGFAGKDEWPLTHYAKNVAHFDIDPMGEEVWWFDESGRGTESGYWMRQPLDPKDRSAAAERVPGLPAGYWYGGLALGKAGAAVGLMVDGEIRIYRVPRDGEATQIATYPPPSRIQSVLLDGTLATVSHVKDTDPLHPAIDVLDLNTGEVRFPLPPRRGIFMRSAEFSPDGSSLVFQEERDNWQGLSLLDLHTGDTRRLPIAFKEAADLDGQWLDSDRLLVTARYGTNSSLHVYNLASRELERAPQVEDYNLHYLSYGEGDIARPTIGVDGAVTFLVSSPDIQPNCYRTIRRDAWRPGPEAAQLKSGHPWWVYSREDPAFPAPMSILLPRGEKPEAGFPTVFLLHGGPHLQDWKVHSQVAVSLQLLGFAVVSVNYRGSTGYGADWQEALLENPCFGELEDVAAARASVVMQGIADPDRCAIMGGSWGGLLTALAPGVQPGLWRAAVAEMPQTDLARDYWLKTATLQAVYRQRFGGSPEENPEIYRKCSPITYVDDIDCPIFIVTGATDPRSPSKPAEDFVAKANEKAKKVILKQLPSGHIDTDMLSQVRVFADIAEFLVENTRPTAPPAPAGTSPVLPRKHGAQGVPLAGHSASQPRARRR